MSMSYANFIKEQKIDTKSEKKCDDLIDSLLSQNIDFKKFLEKLTQIADPLICQLLESDGFILESLKSKIPNLEVLSDKISDEWVAQKFINAYYQEFMAEMVTKARQKIADSAFKRFLLLLRKKHILPKDAEKAKLYFNERIVKELDKLQSMNILDYFAESAPNNETAQSGQVITPFEEMFKKSFAIDGRGSLIGFSNLCGIAKKNKIPESGLSTDQIDASWQYKNTQVLKIQDEMKVLKGRRTELIGSIIIGCVCAAASIAFLLAGFTTGLLVPIAITSAALTVGAIAVDATDLFEKHSRFTKANNARQALIDDDFKYFEKEYKGGNAAAFMRAFFLDNKKQEKKHSQAALTLTIASIFTSIGSSIVNIALRLPSIISSVTILAVSIVASLIPAIKRTWKAVKDFFKESLQFKSRSDQADKIIDNRQAFDSKSAIRHSHAKNIIMTKQRKFENSSMQQSHFESDQERPVSNLDSERKIGKL